MAIIQRYLVKTIIKAILMVVVVVAGLEIFISFVNELNDIGKGDYNVVEAFLFVTLQLPMLIYSLFPLASLLGCILGLGLLASHSELTVMRSAGVSIYRIAMAVIVAAIGLLLVITSFSELLGPKLENYSQQRKASAISGGQALRTAYGLWLHRGNTFIHIDKVHANGKLDGVRSYKLNDSQKLQETLYAQHGTYANGKWVLKDVAISKIGASNIQSMHFDNYPWSMSLSPSLLNVSAEEPDEMSLRYLYNYIKGHKDSFGEVVSYRLAFWNRILQPLATCVMMLLAIPFVFGSQRDTTMGSRLVLGIVVGFGFYTLNEFFGPVSLVFQVPPFMAALSPILIFSIAALVMIRRVR